jgi:hypothetical protein
MSDSIRQQIIEAVVVKIAEIRIDKGYKTDMGKNVDVYKMHNPSLPYVAVWPGLEEINREYGSNQINMNMKVEGVQEIGSGDMMELSEQILADLIENIAGIKWTLDFTSGGTHVPSVGDTVTGETSGATAYIESITLDSGSWAGGDAAGSFTLRRKVGVFISEDLEIGGESNVATTDGTITSSSAESTTTDDLADDIQYVSGGLEEYPESGNEVVGMSANFIIAYPITMGNPYSQP